MSEGQRYVLHLSSVARRVPVNRDEDHIISTCKLSAIMCVQIFADRLVVCGGTFERGLSIQFFKKGQLCF